MSSSKPKTPSMSQNKRLILWTVLGFGLVASIGLLLRSMGDDPGPVAFPTNATLRLIDHDGKLVGNAEPLLMVPIDRKDAPLQTRWDPRSATVELPVLPLQTKLLVAAPGYRLTRVGDLGTSRDVKLERGIPVRLKLIGGAPAMNPPLVGLLRVRPTAATMQIKDEATQSLTLDLSSLMAVQTPSRDDAIELPRGTYGFAVSEEDASIGIRLPEPGRYLVRWGILDERPGTWFTLPDARDVEIEVKDLVTPQTFEIRVTRDLWNRTREGLRKIVDEMRDAGS